MNFQITADRTHQAHSHDGTLIAGSVVGKGPPLVLLHAGLGDGMLDWSFALPLLKERFTCYCMSTRGRGLSGDHSDHSFARGMEDVVAFIESVGEPVGLAGPSGGAMDVLAAAAHSKAVAAAAVCDPLALEVLSEDDGARLQDAVERMAALAEENRLVEAARDWMTEWATDDEMAALSDSGYLAQSARYVPILLKALQQGGSEDFSPTDPSLLRKIAAPVLILQGAEAESFWPWFGECVRHVARYVPHASVRQVEGAGHMGAWVRPEVYAKELSQFFESHLERD